MLRIGLTGISGGARGTAPIVCPKDATFVVPTLNQPAHNELQNLESRRETNSA
jgi:hypothetical protein